MPFQFTPYTSPLTNSIAERIGQAGAIEAQRAYATGTAAANAALQSGNAWGGAIRGIGDTIGALPGQIAAINRSNTVDQMNKIKLADAQQQQKGEQAVAGLMQGDTLPLGQEGPRRESYLDADGLYDVPKLTARLGAIGYGDRAAGLVQGAEKLNESMTTAAALKDKTAQAHAILYGDMADGILQLRKAGTPADQAFDIVGDGPTTKGLIAPQDLARVRQQILSLPPEQQDAALLAIRDRAEKLAPTTTLAEGAQKMGRYGTVLGKGGEKPPTEAELALKAAGGDAAATGAMKLLKPAPPPRPIEEQLLEAIANGDTTKASQITQTLRASAQARQDPAAAKLASEMGGLRVEEARARLDALKAAAEAKAQGKPLPATEADKISDIDKGISAIRDLRESIATGSTGGWAQAEATFVPNALADLVPGAAAAKATQADITRAQQVVGRIIHGGVMRANDAAAAGKYMPALGDSPSVIRSKLDAVEKLALQTRTDHLSNLGKSGYNVSNFSAADVAAPGASAPSEGTTGVVNGVPAVWKTVNGKAGWYKQ